MSANVKKVYINESVIRANDGTEVRQLVQTAAPDTAEGDNVFLVEETEDGQKLLSTEPEKRARYSEFLQERPL